MKDLLGGKGANLAEMTHLGLPVPPGFTITTEVCEYYLKNLAYPQDFQKELDRKLALVKRDTSMHGLPIRGTKNEMVPSKIQVLQFHF